VTWRRDPISYTNEITSIDAKVGGVVTFTPAARLFELSVGAAQAVSSRYFSREVVSEYGLLGTVFDGLADGFAVGAFADKLAHLLYWQLLVERDHELTFFAPAPALRCAAAHLRLGARLDFENDNARTAVGWALGRLHTAEAVLSFEKLVCDPEFCAALEAAGEIDQAAEFLRQQGFFSPAGRMAEQRAARAAQRAARAAQRAALP
jgi:hypothetical protein